MFEISISVIITCRNLHAYLPECVESVKAQTMRATEIIVVHDACETPPVFRETHTLVFGSHKGVAHARNQGALVAQSEQLLFVDGDDVLDEHFIEAMVKVKQSTEADIIYPNVLLWSSWHKEIKLRNAWHEATKKVTKENMLEYNQIVVSSLIAKDLYFRAGGTPSLPILEDYQLWMECVKLGVSFAKSPFSVLKYRQRTEGRLRQNAELKNQWYYKIRSAYENT